LLIVLAVEPQKIGRAIASRILVIQFFGQLHIRDRMPGRLDSQTDPAGHDSRVDARLPLAARSANAFDDNSMNMIRESD
jgi:hypothetical protein